MPPVDVEAATPPLLCPSQLPAPCNCPAPLPLPCCGRCGTCTGQSCPLPAHRKVRRARPRRKRAGVGGEGRRPAARPARARVWWLAGWLAGWARGWGHLQREDTVPLPPRARCKEHHTTLPGCHGHLQAHLGAVGPRAVCPAGRLLARLCDAPSAAYCCTAAVPQTIGSCPTCTWRCTMTSWSLTRWAGCLAELAGGWARGRAGGWARGWVG